jgi:hypothetical protein
LRAAIIAAAAVTLKLAYYRDRNFTSRCLSPPALARADRPGSDDWSGRMRGTDARLEQPWSDLVSTAGRTPELTPPQERAQDVSDARTDLDLLRDDDIAGPAHHGEDAVTGPANDDDLAPAL